MVKAKKPVFRRKIVITHEFAPFLGGVATYCAEVARAAAALGHDVEVWTPGTPQAADRDFLPCRIVRLGGRSSLRIGSLIHFGIQVWRRRRALREAEVILGSIGAHRIFVEMNSVGLLLNIPFALLFHGSEVPRYNLRWIRIPMRWWLRRATGIFSTSRYAGQLLEQSGLLSQGRVVKVAPCALRPDLLEAARRFPDADPDPGRPVSILTLARLHPRKGQLETARALGGLPETIRRKCIYQIGGTGDDAYLRQVEGACRNAGVNFAYLGPIPEEGLAETYAQCDFHVMTSRALPRSVEGFGLTYLEAGIFGKPSVAYRTGGVPEAVLDGVSGLLVEEGDQAGLTRALQRLIDDRELRRVLGEGARTHAAARGWDEAARVLFGEPA